MRRVRRRFLAASLVAAIAAAVAPARAQTYPAHPVRLISDSAPGSAIDVAMRIIADGLPGSGISKRW